MEVTGQLSGVCSLLLPCEFLESNSGIRIGGRHLYAPSHLTGLALPFSSFFYFLS